YNTPHSPFQVPDEYFDMYIDRVEEADTALRIMNASVYGMVRNIDDNVGRVMGTLRELGIEEHTMVVFLTDNGPNTERFNADMKGRKGWVNDGGVRVPCFIQWKGHVPDNRVVTSMTAHIDLLPTLVNMMGVAFEPQKEVHGIDLSPRIFGVDKEQDRFLFTHVNHGPEVKPAPGAVRSPVWRFTYRNPDQPELTRRSDAGEIHNLAGSLPELTDSLMSLYHEWFEPFTDHEIPPIPVGVIDSVILPAHEGFIEGSAKYHWSSSGWSNDWVTSLEGEKGTVSWPVEVRESGVYDCQVKYTSPSGTASLAVDFSGTMLEQKVPEFIPEKDRNYSRIDRPAEAIGQTWGRVSMGEIKLEQGI
ncbi:MAG: sulfatase-like hydrolase/transferase, partial [Bacteroidales bacterium]|nr:sulfatase-like hydrolase/transferase [Bacteroidales bacterium]